MGDAIKLGCDDHCATINAIKIHWVIKKLKIKKEKRKQYVIIDTNIRNMFYVYMYIWLYMYIIYTDNHWMEGTQIIIE